MTIEQFLALVVLTFAVYRLSCFVAEDIGPWRVCERFRATLPEGWQRQGVECVGCVGFWIALLAAVNLVLVGVVPHEYGATVWLAISGGVCFLNRLAPCP